MGTVASRPTRIRPPGPAVERADQEHEPADADGERRVRRVRHGHAGDVDDPQDADRQRDQREGEPEQDRSTPARVAGRRRTSSAAWYGRYVALVRSGPRMSAAGRYRCSVGRGALVGRRPSPVADDRSAPGTRRRRRGAAVLAGHEQQHDQGDDRQRPREPEDAPGVAEQRERREHADGQQGDGAAAVVEGDRCFVRAVLGHEQPAGAVQQQAGAAEEGEHDERHPQDAVGRRRGAGRGRRRRRRPSGRRRNGGAGRGRGSRRG